MVEFESTTQFTVKCTGSSRPVVESFDVNEKNPDHIDLLLKNDPLRSEKIEDYTIQRLGVEYQAVELNGNVLTVKIK